MRQIPHGEATQGHFGLLDADDDASDTAAPSATPSSLSRLDRRRFIKTAVVGAFGAAFGDAAPSTGHATSRKSRPNILLIITDQQCWNMMGCSGNRWLNTPAMDRLAASGTRFELAYVTNPVCSPSRFSMQTGRMPSAAGINDSWDAPEGRVPDSVLETSLGPLFHRAGYDVVYGGKTHLPEVFRDQFGGQPYRYFEESERDRLAEACAAYLKGPHEKPFFLTASLINPHDICYVAINAFRASQGQSPIFDEVDTSGELLKQVQGIQDRAAFFAKECPPLPPNHAIPTLEPAAITEKYLDPKSYWAFRAWVRQHWTDEDWRIHSWIYHRLTERADREIHTILTALREADLERNTLVVFTSDHGELNGAHKLEHKSVLYEEAMRVPFVMSYPGVVPELHVDKTHLVSTGLDLLPTLCDYAGIKIPPVALDGRSLRSLVEGHTPRDWRSYVIVESQHDRMIRTERFKYCLYTSGAHREQLNDLVTDPGEMNNLAEQPTYANILKEHQDLLNQWMGRTWDYDYELVFPYLVFAGADRHDTTQSAVND